MLRDAFFLSVLLNKFKINTTLLDGYQLPHSSNRRIKMNPISAFEAKEVPFGSGIFGKHFDSLNH